MLHIWGIDLGGTKIEGVVFAVGEHKPLCRIRIETEASKGYDHIIEQIKKLIERMAKDVGSRPERVGIGTPGAYDRATRSMKNCNTTSLNGRDLQADLEAALEMPVVLSNDANCFALAEARLGAAQGFPTVFGVIMGTGVGGGIVVNGEVLGGAQGIAGEWGHNVLDESGPVCYSGVKGCVEAFLSGPALEKFYEELAGERRLLKDIHARYLAGVDDHASTTMRRLVHYFGKALATVINILDPHIIVLGGGVGNIDLLYTEGVSELGKHVFNTRLDTKIVKPQLGDSAGVFGAAMLVAPKA